MSNVILIGFMGAGKSTVGKELSKKLDYEFIDIDSFIEETAQKSISDIFKMAGEKWFRDQETMILESLTKGDRRVIATGGGIVEKEENRKLLKTCDKVIYLKATVDKLWTRVGKDKTRPLSNDLSTFRKRFDNRKPLYEEAASYIVDTDGKSIDDIVDEIGGIL